MEDIFLAIAETRLYLITNRFNKIDTAIVLRTDLGSLLNNAGVFRANPFRKFQIFLNQPFNFLKVIGYRQISPERK